jgi:hypothetical protein
MKASESGWYLATLRRGAKPLRLFINKGENLSSDYEWENITEREGTQQARFSRGHQDAAFAADDIHSGPGKLAS